MASTAETLLLRALGTARGAAWMVERGFGWASDLEAIEAGGVLEGADPEAVSERALERGRAQLRVLGDV